MRKISVFAIAFVLFVSISYSQNKQLPKKEVSKATTTKVVLKKDGTRDKRFKQTKKTTLVLKKDGTPDRRYKASKKQ